MKRITNPIIDLIKSSKIIQIGILLIMLSISMAIISSDKFSLWGLEIDQVEMHDESLYHDEFNQERDGTFSVEHKGK